MDISALKQTVLVVRNTAFEIMKLLQTIATDSAKNRNQKSNLDSTYNMTLILLK